MKILLIVVIVLALPVLVPAVIGAMLPRDHTATRSAVFNVSAERLFELIAGPQDWRRDLKSYQRGRDAAGNAWIRKTNRRGQTVTYAVVALDPPRRYVARISDRNLPYGGQWTYEFEPRGPQQVSLRITEQGEVYNPLFRFVSRFVIGHTATIDQYLRALAGQTGGSVSIQP